MFPKLQVCRLCVNDEIIKFVSEECEQPFLYLLLGRIKLTEIRFKKTLKREHVRENLDVAKQATLSQHDFKPMREDT